MTTMVLDSTKMAGYVFTTHEYSFNVGKLVHFLRGKKKKKDRKKEKDLMMTDVLYNLFP